LLEQEAELIEIVRLVGADALSPKDRLALETSRSIREDFLHQNAFHPVDTYSSSHKQYRLLKMIMSLHHAAKAALETPELDIQALFSLPVNEEIARAKFTSEEEVEASFDRIESDMQKQIEELITEGPGT
ncbi:V-type ATP synthase subunit A, partial [bacterium]|nr:V-type ATP synthase subunit A [bacterium]